MPKTIARTMPPHPKKVQFTTAIAVAQFTVTDLEKQLARAQIRLRSLEDEWTQEQIEWESLMRGGTIEPPKIEE